MKNCIKISICLLLVFSNCISGPKEEGVDSSIPSHENQIIADHSVVDKYKDIPQYYIDEVKKMWLVIAGESHAEGYLRGLELLEAADPTFQVNRKYYGPPDAYTTLNLRASNMMWGDFNYSTGWQSSYGEEDWWTNTTGIGRTKASITYCNVTYGTVIAAVGFGWCWDMVGAYYSASIDPVYGVHWYGWTNESPTGIGPFGLDAADNSLTGNAVCLDTYLSATQQYIDYCRAQGYPTKVYFTTGPVDGDYNTGEKGYQGYLKHQHIRNYVLQDSTRILFDYSDILCYDNDGTPTTATWNGHTFPRITSTNLGDGSIGHISSEGAIRLGKAMWWMLARMAGWDGK